LRSRRSVRSLFPAVLAVGLAPVLLATPVLAQAGDGWSQFQGGPAHTGVAATGPAPGYRLAWEFLQAGGGPRGEYGLSAPVVTGDTVVAVGPESIVGLTVATGDVAWSIDRALGPSVGAAVAQGPDGPVVLFTEGWGDGPPDVDQTPTVTTSTSASASPSAVPGDAGPTDSRLMAFTPRETEPLWTVDLPAVSRTGVTITGDLAVVGGIDGSITAVEVATGDEAWTANVGGFVESSIAATDDLIVVPVRGDQDTAVALVALAVSDGEQAWRYEPATTSYAGGAPSIDDDTAYVTFADGTVRAVALADGAERWRAILNASVNPFSAASSPVLVDGAVLVADVRGQVYRLDAATGDRVWDHAYNRPVIRSTPVAVGDHLVLATTDGHLAAFELSSGDLVWESALGDASLRSIAVADDTLVIARGGASAGMAGIVHDPAAASVRVQSPTILRPAAMLAGWAAGFVVAMGLLLGGRVLWARLGPPEIPSEDEGEPDGEEES